MKLFNQDGLKTRVIFIAWLIGLLTWISTITGSYAEYEFHAAKMFGLVTAFWCLFGIILWRLLRSGNTSKGQTGKQ